MRKKWSTADLPTRMADVAGWCESLRERRLNDEGRAAIDVLELQLTLLVEAIESSRGPAGRARLMASMSKAIEQQFRVALMADRAEGDQELVRMRKLVEQQHRAEDDLRAMH